MRVGGRLVTNLINVKEHSTIDALLKVLLPGNAILVQVPSGYIACVYVCVCVCVCVCMCACVCVCVSWGGGEGGMNTKRLNTGL